MSMSNLQAIKIALIPCAAESLERRFSEEGNLGWCGMATSVKFERNALYFCTAMTAMASVGMLQSDESSEYRKLAFAGTTVICASITALVAKRLYDVTSAIQKLVNTAPRPS